MPRKPNEVHPAPAVPVSFVPPSGVRRPVKAGETWGTIANELGISAIALMDFNFPGTRAMFATAPERAKRQVNWYLREYVGCNHSDDKENWAFTGGLSGGKGGWLGGHIYTPPPPAAPAPPAAPPPFCPPGTSPTTSGKFGRRPTFYRPLNARDQQLAAKVFGNTLPPWNQIGIGDGLGFDGRPWTDMRDSFFGLLPASSLMPNMRYQINLGDAASADLTSVTLHSQCMVVGISGTVADLLIHEMVHVWQYYNKTKSPRIVPTKDKQHYVIAGRDDPRYSVWASSVTGSYGHGIGKPWAEYDVEHQATIVEDWFHLGASKLDPRYPYIRLVLQQANLDEDNLAYMSSLNLSELNQLLAAFRATHGASF
jgi:hypothetical protein